MKRAWCVFYTVSLSPFLHLLIDFWKTTGARSAMLSVIESITTFQLFCFDRRNMKHIGIVIVITVVVLFPVRDALKCYRCNKLAHPKDCKHLVECGHNEVCYVEGNITHDHGLQYTSGCLSSTTCGAILHTDSDQHHIFGKRDARFCQICCEKDFCNTELCDRKDTSVTDGPKCMSCKSVDDPRQCLQEAQCRKEETCFTIQTSINTAPKYDMGCIPKRDCMIGYATYNQSHTRTASSSKCSQCCVVDHCNLHLCTGESVVHPYQIKTTAFTNSTCVDLNHEMCSYMLNIQTQSCSDENIAQMCKKSCNKCHSDTCRDTTDFDCAVVARHFNICADTEQAKRSCPFFCNYCNPVDGAWSTWSPWESGVSDCSGGTQIRRRQCNNPVPSHGGRPCQGENQDIKNTSGVTPIVFVLVLVFSSVTDAIKCYRCDRLTHPKDCEHLVECGHNEACYVEGNVTDTGQLQYTSGCLSNTTCNAVLHTNFGQQDILVGKRDTSFCRICCDKDFCNNELCDKTEVIGTVGPKCMSCKYIDDPRKCLHETQCRNEETCYTKQSDITTTPYYDMGCIHKRDCQMRYSLQSQPIVGRLTGTTCSQCCIGDHCNLHLCTGESVVNAYHLIGNTTSSGTCEDLNQEMCNFMVHVQGQSCSNLNIVRMCKKTCNNCELDNCRDTTEFDCAIVARHFNICEDIQSAKAKCPMFCDYCNPVDGAWSSWTSWTDCVSKFGNETGSKSRTRQCRNPPPSHGGNPCPGGDTDTTNCTISVNGGWSEWSPWGQCDPTCENGNRTRNRTCDNPVPINGLDCDGNSTESAECYVPCSGVRLRGGNSTSGRVEVFYNGKWGTTCDDTWNSAHARVVCRMLGFSNGTAQGNAFYGQGTGTILLDDVKCAGNEITLFQCNHTAWGVSNCGHGEDAGVSCFS